jgi:acyl-CoA thioesterase-1
MIAGATRPGVVVAVSVAWLLASGACGSGDRVREPAAPVEVTATPGAATPVPARPRIVALGDSLTAGLGLDPDEAYPAVLQQRIDQAGLRYEVVNAGVSGETSAGGLRRLDWALDGDVRVVIVALGGNDALRGLPVDQLRSNLSAIIEHARARGIHVILAGMEAPPNFGAAYTTAFRQVYADLARTYAVPFVPFLLEGVAGHAQMNQRDQIHPTAQGARKIADNIWAALHPVLLKHD